MAPSSPGFGSCSSARPKRLAQANGAPAGFCGGGTVVDGPLLTPRLPFSPVSPLPFAFLPHDLPHDAVGTPLLLPPLSPVLLSTSPIDEWFSRGECALGFNLSPVPLGASPGSLPPLQLATRCLLCAQCPWWPLLVHAASFSSSPLGSFSQKMAKSCWADVAGERCLMPLCLPFEGKKLPEDPGADTVDFPKRATPAKGTLPGVLVQGWSTQSCFSRAVGKGAVLISH